MIKFLKKIRNFFFYLFIVINLFTFIKNDETEGDSLVSIANSQFPNIFTLLNNNLVIVLNDGIHFFSSDMVEDKSKKITFEEEITTEAQCEKISMTQFSENYGGYIILYAQGNLYFFENDGKFIKSFDCSIISDYAHSSLIPYKREDNYLYYLISYPIDVDKFGLLYYKQDINTPYTNGNIFSKEIECIVESTQSTPLQISGVNCVFLYHTSLNKDLLVCFNGVFSPPEIQSRLFDPTNNFEELMDLHEYYAISIGGNFVMPTYIYAMLNGEKNKIVIFFADSLPYYITYDYDNSFGEPVLLSDYDRFQRNFYYYKAYYLRQTHEFILATMIRVNCEVYIIVFNSDLSIKNFQLINPDLSCYNLNVFSVFFNDGYYRLAVDEKYNDPRIIIYKVTDLGTSEIVESPILNYNTYGNELSLTTIITTILTTTPLIETTIPKIDTTVPLIVTTIPLIETTLPIIETTILTTKIIETTIPIETTFPIITTILTTQILETTIPIETTLPIIITTILTTQILETTISIETTLPKIITTILTTQLLETTIPIQTTSPSSESIIEIIEPNNKRKKSSEESLKYNLCLECNTGNNFYPVEEPKYSSFHGFAECYNKETKKLNFYFDSIERKYKPCYEACLTCEIGGNEFINNCLICEINHIKRPDVSNSTNCVPECSYFYYYTKYGQYKCTKKNYCPEEVNLYIKDIKKCTNYCKNEEIYKYQYNGECLKNCPKNTISNENNMCIDINSDICPKTESEIVFQETMEQGFFDIKVKKYASEFIYTNNHISVFYNNFYSMVLYKNQKCIDELNINIPKIDLDECFLKAQNNSNPSTNNKIIIALIEKFNDYKKSTFTYSFYHPETGEKIDLEEICKDDEIIVKENVISKLNESNVDLSSILFLTEQNIDIFNLSNRFYTDICYHFDSKNGKDIPLIKKFIIIE